MTFATLLAPAQHQSGGVRWVQLVTCRDGCSCRTGTALAPCRPPCRHRCRAAAAAPHSPPRRPPPGPRRCESHFRNAEGCESGFRNAPHRGSVSPRNAREGPLPSTEPREGGLHARNETYT
ncbi:hypothetical protein DL991_09160 [Amycolatopsis sp. WAC 01375]|nr:hypothetical protein DL991_09160 [Amycolatopsis sp. WAC 01375]